MRIGFDARLINETGVGRYIQCVLPLLVSNKKISWVVIVRKEERKILNKILKNSNKKNISVVEFNERWHSLREQIFLPRVLNKLKLDLYHTPYINVPVFYNKPQAVTIHDLTLLTHKTGRSSTKKLTYFLYKLGYRLVLRKALSLDVIFTVSNSVKKEILQKFPKTDEKKIKVVQNGYFKIKSSKKYNPFIADLIKSNSPYFFYMGNAQPHKNLDFLVESLDKFFDKISRYKFVIAGRDDFFMQKLVQKVKSLKNSANFVFVKNPKDSDLYLLYKGSVGLILPSFKEGFGLQILEAMQCETLIVASSIDSYKEIGSTSLLYFNPTNQKSFFMALSKLLRLGTLDKKQILNKYKTILSRYNFKITAKETLNSYIEFLDNSKPKKKNIKNLVIQNYFEKTKK